MSNSCNVKSCSNPCLPPILPDKLFRKFIRGNVITYGGNTWKKVESSNINENTGDSYEIITVFILKNSKIVNKTQIVKIIKTIK